MSSITITIQSWSTFVKSQSMVHVQIVWCWLLFEDDGQREKGLSLVRLLSAPSTASGMWSASILGLIKILLKAISLDQSARYRTLEKQDLRRKRQREVWRQIILLIWGLFLGTDWTIHHLVSQLSFLQAKSEMWLLLLCYDSAAGLLLHRADTSGSF